MFFRIKSSRFLLGGFLALLSFAGFCQVVQPSSTLYLRSTPGDPVGQGQTVEMTSPALATSTLRTDADRHQFEFEHGGSTYHLHLSAPVGAGLVPGVYEEAVPYGTARSFPGLAFAGEGRGCTGTGRFVVLEAVYDSDGEIATFAAQVEQHCEGDKPPLFIEVRVNSTLPLSFREPSPDTMPDPFELRAQSPARAGASVLSNRITVYGIGTPTAVAVSGGEYSVNGGPYTSAAGTVNELDVITVRLAASNVPGATSQATLDVGGASSTLSVQTYEPGMVLSGIQYHNGRNGDSALLLSPRNSTSVSRPFSDQPELWSLAVNEPTGPLLSLGAPNGARLAPGSHEEASGALPIVSDKPFLDLGGDGVGNCGDDIGRFVVHEAAHAADGSLVRLAADFERRCFAGDEPVTGEVRYNSTVPFSALQSPSQPGQPGRLVNLAARARVQTGEDVAIAGFILGGRSNKTVMVRARGPSLASHGVADFLANPTLQLFRSSDGGLLASNDDWGAASNALAVQWTGFQPSDERESAILASLAPGAYTAIVSGAGASQGVAIIEVFEIAQPEVALANLSARARVQQGDNVLIGGLVIQGDHPKTVVLRGRGPSLANHGIAGPLADPQLQLFRADQSIVSANDNWQDASNAPALQASGFAPSDATEAAMLVTLPPGAYTVILSGVGGANGVGIVEVFAVP